MRRGWSWAAGVLALAVSGSVPAAYSGLYVFGDSLSDNGTLAGAFGVNLPAPWSSDPPLNRVSNGPVAVERLAARLGLDLRPSLHLSALGFPPVLAPVGTDYAVATARARAQGDFFADLPSLGVQVATFLGYTPSAPSDALYVVFIGGNDVLDIRAEADDGRAAAVIDSATRAVGSALDGLIEAGARQILVPNVFDIGLTPAAAGAPGLATRRTLEYNQALAGVIAGVEGARGVDLIEYDLFGLGQALARDPAAFGFANFADPCTDGGAAELPPRAPAYLDGCSALVIDQYAFFDDIHPTAALHALIGEELYAAVIPVPAALPLFASALLLIGMLGRRRLPARPRAA